MAISVDFKLNRRFGAVEKLIFRLVLNGLSEVDCICDILWIFSSEVCSNAIRRLVNCQILSADLDKRQLSLSAPIFAVIQSCGRATFEIELLDVFRVQMNGDSLLIDDTKLKESILHQLVPHAKLDFLGKMLDFYICERDFE